MKEEAARTAARQAFTDMGGGFNPHLARDANMTLDAAFRDYLETRVDLAPATSILYRKVFDLYLEKSLGHVPVFDLGKNPRRVAQVFADVTRENGPGAGNQGAGNQVAQLVRMIYNRELKADEKDSWPPNPVSCGRKGRLYKMNKLIARETIIPEGGFRAWVEAVRSIENPVRRAGQLWMLLRACESTMFEQCSGAHHGGED